MDITAGLGVSQQQTLRQTLSPQQLQYVAMLQMNAAELNDYLNTLETENPLVELTTPARRESAPVQEPADFARWLTAKPAARPDEDPADHDPAAKSEPSLDSSRYDLADYLRSQFDFSLTRAELPILERLMGCIDENGYLPFSAEELAALWGLDAALVAEALDYLRALDPPGVAGRDLGDCLCIQLARRGITDPDAHRIAREFLEELAHGHFQKIAAALGCTTTHARELCSIIRSLNPRPAAAFGARTTQYILPDVTVTVVDGEPVCSYNRSRHASLSINQRTLALAEQDGEAREYLNRKLSQAMWVAKAIETRQDTIERVTQAIVRRQRDFFLHNGALAPLRLRDVAQELSVHESTVSRALREKYLECKRGVFPLKFFFSSALGEQAQGSHSVKAHLRALIAAEDPAHPLSDNALAARLAEAGVTAARRTVAKYREELGIPAASLRKQ